LAGIAIVGDKIRECATDIDPEHVTHRGSPFVIFTDTALWCESGGASRVPTSLSFPGWLAKAGHLPLLWRAER
jgi:hypothetical protein